ncbi:MAG: type 1 glutamine amidotransferase [Paracoccaceae bacterium]|nr:type 1 glutamine amidotransferase [Paracoccaceae bacterium]
MQITVLDLTGHPLPLLSGLPRAGAQIISWLSAKLPEAEFDSVSVEVDNEGLPEPDSFDGLILSGSEYGVYDSRPWIPLLRKLLLETKKAGKPIYGICFGHQIMADTFGGKAEKSQIGNVVGMRQFHFRRKFFDTYVWHQDQITSVPPKAQVTAIAEYCAVGALSYDFPAVSVQFHPEYTEGHLRKMFERSVNYFLTPEEVADALVSFENSDIHGGLFATEAANFFRLHI